MRNEDIPFGIRLSDQEKWGITRNDLRRILRLNPRGSFVAYEGARRLGMATTTSYGKKVAWIGNVIVDQRYRGKHIGQRLVEHAIASLKKSEINHIAIYCYNQHVEFYDNLGFIRDGKFLRMRRRGSEVHYPGSPHYLEDKLAFDRLLLIDRQAFGADRSKLIELLRREANIQFMGFSRGTESAAYLIIKTFPKDSEYGPWVGVKANKDELIAMLRAALVKTGSNPIEVSCLRNNTPALDLLRAHGFRTVMEGSRMYYEERPHIGNDRSQYALGFLDKG
jgi:ribosomal protein S18 acetylase RimI-like enzyme